MTSLWKLVRVSPALMVVFTLALASGTVRAEDGKTPQTAEPSDSETPDIYTLPPSATVEQLLDVIQAMRSFRPTSREEYRNHVAKAPAVLKSAAEQILELEKDPKSKAARLATAILLQDQARRLRKATPEEQASLYAKVKEYVSTSDKTADDLTLAMNVALGMEYGNARDLAAKAYAEYGEMLSKSSDPEVAEQAEILIGAGRRMNLVGRPLELKGTTIKGEHFNLESLKGKVVLVDFWATWCGPCLAEYPNILKNYEAYHDKGFEVVGVSLDADREALEKYVDEKQVPWTTLHEKDAKGRHPAATYYGIIGIPAVILVNKEGHVISLAARGEELGKLLEQELGPVEVKDEAK